MASSSTSIVGLFWMQRPGNLQTLALAAAEVGAGLFDDPRHIRPPLDHVIVDAGVARRR